MFQRILRGPFYLSIPYSATKLPLEVNADATVAIGVQRGPGGHSPVAD